MSKFMESRVCGRFSQKFVFSFPCFLLVGWIIPKLVDGNCVLSNKSILDVLQMSKVHGYSNPEKILRVKDNCGMLRNLKIS